MDKDRALGEVLFMVAVANTVTRQVGYIPVSSWHGPEAARDMPEQLPSKPTVSSHLSHCPSLLPLVLGLWTFSVIKYGLFFSTLCYETN